MMENKKDCSVLEEVGKMAPPGKGHSQEINSAVCHQQAKVGAHIGGWCSGSLEIPCGCGQPGEGRDTERGGGLGNSLIRGFFHVCKAYAFIYTCI